MMKSLRTSRAGTLTIYGPVDNESDLLRVLQRIRDDVQQAVYRDALTRLYRRAGHLLELAGTPAWLAKLGDQGERVRRSAEDEFRQIAREINLRAGDIGTQPNYFETGDPVGAGMRIHA